MKHLFILAFLSTIALKAQVSPILGNWQLKKVIQNNQTQEGFSMVFVFAEAGVLKAARSTKENIINVGTWQYNTKTSTLIMKSDRDKDFRGTATVIKLDKKTLVYIKDKVEMTFYKVSDKEMKPLAPVTKIKPQLNFTTDDFWDETGARLITQDSLISQLPWQFNDVATHLKNYKDVVYTVSNFRGDLPPDTFIVSERIAYNKEENTIDIRDYSISNNRYIEMTTDEIPIETLNAIAIEEQPHFYPADELDPFRVVGVEKIMTVLGERTCTIIEGFDSYDNKIKYWMINDKPGVFAKIIIINPLEAPFGYSNIKALKEFRQ